MTSEDFKSWRKELGLSQREAADMIGVSKGSVENYERGHRLEDNRSVVIPKTVALACAAVFHRLQPWGTD